MTNQIGKTLPTLDRGRRCQNCSSFENGPMALNHYKSCKMRDLQAAAGRVLGEKATPALLSKRLADEGKPTPVRDLTGMDAQMRALGLNYELGDALIRTGELGICLINAAPGDFVHFGYLCNRYTARVVVDDAGKEDELPGHARERIFGSDK